MRQPNGPICLEVSLKQINYKVDHKQRRRTRGPIPQALHSWFAHIPGLIVMPYSVNDAKNLLISSVLSNDPVIYIDDRWLYDQKIF